MITKDSPLTLGASDLFRQRGRAVASLLRPLAAGQRLKVDLADGMWHGGKAFGAFDAMKPKTDPREWLFRTFVPNISGNYFELWKPIEGGELFGIDRAYLSIFRVVPPATKDYLICLHSDPHDGAPDPMGRWKRGPHVHVLKAEDPLPKCHIPLNYGHLDQVMTSMDSLMAAMGDAVNLIVKDVLPRYR